jgi:integrase
MIDALAHAIFTCYVVLLDCEAGAELPEFFATPERTYGTALMFVTERFHHLLEAEDDNSLRRFFGALIEGGTPYVQLDRIVEGLFLGPSHATGLRPEEWIALQWVDLDLANRRVTVSKVCVDGVVHWDRGKTDASFRVGLLQERALDAIRSLARPLDSSALVFPSPKGGYINLDNWRRRVWKPALASAKLEYRPLYQCRHTYATLALSAGADLYWVSKQLGHTDIRTTLRFYARFQPAVDSRNLELLDAFEDDLELEDGASDVSESGHTSNR